MNAKDLKAPTKQIQRKAVFILLALSLGLFVSRYAESKTLLDMISTSEPKYSLELKQLEDNTYEATIYRMDKDSGIFYETSNLKFEKQGTDKIYKDNRMTLLEKSNGQVLVRVDNGELKNITFTP